MLSAFAVLSSLSQPPSPALSSSSRSISALEPPQLSMVGGAFAPPPPPPPLQLSLFSPEVLPPSQPGQSSPARLVHCSNTNCLAQHPAALTQLISTSSAPVPPKDRGAKAKGPFQMALTDVLTRPCPSCLQQEPEEAWQSPGVITYKLWSVKSEAAQAGRLSQVMCSCPAHPHLPHLQRGLSGSGFNWALHCSLMDLLT